jgi:D-alanyl-lipoteichoic acid acyltransferase DltB (MBOAT superfamily)
MGFIPKYILILAFTITIDYFAGILIEKLSGRRKKYFLILSILSNIGILFVFKYFNFFNINLAAFAELINWNYSIKSLSLILPIGLSFHTFQSLSYIIEVYYGRQKAERNPGIFALYVMFYPQLVAGPIERPQRLLHQFHEKHYFQLANFFSGLRLIIWGLFKKVVIADRVSFFVNQIFNDVHSYDGPYFILATFLFAFQIYCDFSGYSDMARGLARTMGFELMINFKAPYFSRSISEFWKRWHISLSSWFRDYVYIPLGGNRVSSLRLQYNIFITFLLSGLWHGANWTYLIWGGLNGFYLILASLSDKIRTKISQYFSLQDTIFQKIYQTLFTFVLISLAWIFFRAQSLNDALYIIKQIFLNGYNLISLKPFLSEYNYSFYIIFSSIFFLMLMDYYIGDDKRLAKLKKISLTTQVLAFSLIIFLIILLGLFINEQFIYFQF